MAALIASQALRRHRFISAERIARRFVRRWPTVDDGWILWAAAVRSQGRVWEAQTILENGLESVPTSLPIMLALNDDLMGELKPEESSSLIERMLAQFPDAPEPCIALAEHLTRSGRFDEGKASLAKAEGMLAPFNWIRRLKALEMIGLQLLMIPGEERSAKRVLTSVASRSRNPAVHLMLSVLLERDDAQASRRRRLEAERLWPGTADEFLLELERVRWLLIDD